MEANDVLFSNVRVNLRKIAFISSPKAIDLCSTGFTVLRSNGAVLPRYLLYAVMRDEFIEAAEATQTGTQYPATSDRHVRSISIPLAPLAEQQRIAEKLDALMRALQAAHERLSAVPTILRRLRENTLATGCTGGLTEQWRIEHPPTGRVDAVIKGVALERNNAPRRKGPRHPRFRDPSPPDMDEVTEGIKLPDGWQWSSVGFGTIQLQYGCSTRSDADSRTGVANLGMQNIQNGRVVLQRMKYVHLQARELKSFSLQPGDVLFNRTNSPDLVGKAAVFTLDSPAVFASYLVRVRADTRLCLPEFLSYWINSPWGRRWAEHVKSDGVSQSNINSTKLAEMPLPLPPIEEQTAICSQIARIVSLTELAERRAADATTRAGRARQAMLVRAFSGRLVPTEASLATAEGRAFESATELLQRVMSGTAKLSITYEGATAGGGIVAEGAPMKSLDTIRKTHLRDILAKRRSGMTPEELFRAAELEVDDFYTELKREVRASVVRQTRKDKKTVLLRAVR